MTHIGRLNPSFAYLPYRQLKIRPFKNPTWCTGAVLKIEKSRYVGKGLTDRDNLNDQPLKLRTPNRQLTLTILLQNQKSVWWLGLGRLLPFLNIATNDNNDIRLRGLH